VLANSGAERTCTDPDAAMLTELRTHVPATVAVVQAAFEGLPLTSTYDLVFAAAALHWTDPAQSDTFTDVRQSTIERRITMSARDDVGHLSTVSAYLELPAPVREHVFGRILAVLPERVAVVADLTLHLARVRSAATSTTTQW
jgi:hypothetical protein